VAATEARHAPKTIGKTPVESRPQIRSRIKKEVQQGAGLGGEVPAGVEGIEGEALQYAREAEERYIDQLMLNEEHQAAAGNVQPGRPSASSSSSSSQPSASSSSSSAAPSAPPATAQPGVQSTVVPANGVAPGGSIQPAKSLPKGGFGERATLFEPQKFRIEEVLSKGKPQTKVYFDTPALDSNVVDGIKREYFTEECLRTRDEIVRDVYVRPEHAQKIGLPSDVIKKTKTYVNDNGASVIEANVQLPGSIKTAEEYFSNYVEEYSRRVMSEKTVQIEGGVQQIRYTFKDGSRVQIRTLGKSGQPKIDIFDVIKNIDIKITFRL
jgi:hypothetical protein